MCSHDYNTETGVLTSPNYPNNYPVQTECIYTITVGINRQIVLRFTNFTLEGNLRCTEDYIEIRQAELFLLFLLLIATKVIQIHLSTFGIYSFNCMPVLSKWKKDLSENFKCYSSPCAAPLTVFLTHKS